MSSLGILVLNLNQEKEYFNRLATHANGLEMEVYRFVPSSVDPQTKTIEGEKYCPSKKKWVTEIFSIPKFLYDRCFYSNETSFKNNNPIVNWLKSHPDTTFIGYGLPNKWKVYNILKKDVQLSPYLPKTIEIKDGKQIIHELSSTSKVLLKPASGSQGKGIIAITKETGGYIVQTQKQKKRILKTFTNESIFIKWINKVIQTKKYLLQPFCTIQDEKGYPFDIRILLQKDEQGEWNEQGRGIRLGKKDHIISNLHGGGKTIPYDSWMKHFSENKKKYLESEINKIIMNLPSTLEKSFGRLFEIGVDISIDQDGHLWLLEANSKPGRQVIVNSHKNLTQLYEAPLRYCKHLENNKELKNNG